MLNGPLTLSLHMIYGPVIFFSLRVCPGDWTDVPSQSFQLSTTQNVIDTAIWLGPISRRVTHSTKTKTPPPSLSSLLTLPSAWQTAELVPLHHESLRGGGNSTIRESGFVTRNKLADLFLQSAPIPYARAVRPELDMTLFMSCKPATWNQGQVAIIVTTKHFCFRSRTTKKLRRLPLDAI
jgi:hypothetical protein